MPSDDHVVFLIDDDPEVRAAVGDVLASAGLNSIRLGSIGEYVALDRPKLPSCIVLDIDLPDVNGLEFQAQTREEGLPPIIFITGNGDIRSSVQAMKHGAIDFLIKPVAHSELIAAIKAGLEKDRDQREAREDVETLRHRFAALTPREREVMALVVSGLLNKQAAAQLGISEITFQIHRRRIMRKMSADSLADLVRSAAKLDIPITQSRHSRAPLK